MKEILKSLGIPFPTKNMCEYGVSLLKCGFSDPQIKEKIEARYILSFSGEDWEVKK